MKKLVYILFFLLTLHTSYAQDDQPGADRLKEKMVEYIQNKLGLSKTEAERFQPMFLDYLRDLRKANQESQGDHLKRQQKILEVRIRFREQWKPIVGEKRSNEVFTYEKEFVQEVQRIRNERIEERSRGRANNKRKDAGL